MLRLGQIAEVAAVAMVGMAPGLEDSAEPYGAPIREGADYVYTGAVPAGCKGHKYRLHREVLDVPSYQRKVLVEALTGADKGLWFTCSLHNFALRYELAPSGD